MNLTQVILVWDVIKTVLMLIMCLTVVTCSNLVNELAKRSETMITREKKGKKWLWWCLIMKKMNMVGFCLITREDEDGVVIIVVKMLKKRMFGFKIEMRFVVIKSLWKYKWWKDEATLVHNKLNNDRYIFGSTTSKNQNVEEVCSYFFIVGDWEEQMF